MSLDAAIRVAERSGDQEEHVRLLIRAGRRKARWQVGDLVERTTFASALLASKERGRIGELGEGDAFAYVIFDDESSRRRMTWAVEDQDGFQRWLVVGRFGQFGTGWPVRLETLKIVEFSENLPPLETVTVCRQHHSGWIETSPGTWGDGPCLSCGRDGKGPREWRSINGQPVEASNAGSGQAGA